MRALEGIDRTFIFFSCGDALLASPRRKYVKLPGEDISRIRKLFRCFLLPSARIGSDAMQGLISLVRGYCSPRQSCELSPANSRVSFMQRLRNPKWLTKRVECCDLWLWLQPAVSYAPFIFIFRPLRRVKAIIMPSWEQFKTWHGIHASKSCGCVVLLPGDEI